MDIMTTLFDQDYITELYGNKQRNEGRIEGRNEERMNSIRNLMQSLSISYDKAMTLLKIPKEDQEECIQALFNEK